ncbi:hypothetical protein [Campylobacter sp. US33a]|nr:hypothetical protein [Campylobacter sp. US33a]
MINVITKKNIVAKVKNSKHSYALYSCGDNFSTSGGSSNTSDL